MTEGPRHWSQPTPGERSILIRVVLAGFGLMILKMSIDQTQQLASDDGSGWKHLIPGAILSSAMFLQAFAKKRGSILLKVSLGLVLLALVSMPLVGRPV